MKNKIAHLLYVPFTGLGLYHGHRGNRWLKNRIKIFKQFVVPSLLDQTSPNFIIWISWRHEDRGDKNITELEQYLRSRGFKTVFTYSGVCFWDDKYEDKVANERLASALLGAAGEVINAIGDAEEVYMTIQPSDDCYVNTMVETVQGVFAETDYQVVAYQKGYVMDYLTKRLAEWNPKTNPPFFTIKFPRETFIDAYKHMEYTGPYKSHEYVGDKLKLLPIYERGFVVGTHGENISTIFQHPFKGKEMSEDTLYDFGLYRVPPLKIRTSLRRAIMRRLPYGWQRKLRYLIGEKFYAKFYEWIRS